MLPCNHPDRIQITFDDHRLVANAGLVLPATLARRLGLPELVHNHLDLGRAPGRANTGDKMMTLVASALAGSDCIDDANVLRTGRTACALGCVVKAPSTPRFREGRLWASSCAAFAGPRPPTGPGEPRVAGPRLAGRSRTRRRTLIARVPGRPDRNHFPKEDFHIDLEAGSCTCPPGNVTRRIVSFGTRTGPTGRTHRPKGFRFDGAVCVIGGVKVGHVGG